MARSHYALGFLTLGLLGTSSLVSPAYAVAVEGQGGWSLNKVASAASGSYCTTTQKFNDNTILTLAKNQAGEYSLAFDFFKPKFADAKPVTITLRPGGASAQTFDVTPTSDKVIVVGLGKSDSFVEAVKSSGKLDLEVSGQSFTFNTKKFAQASSDLSTCVSTMKAPAPIVAAESPAPTITSSVKKLMQEEQAAARSEPLPVPAAPVVTAKQAAPDPRINELEAENARLKQAVAETRQNLESRQSQVAVASELQEKLARVESENAALKTQISKIQVPAPAPVPTIPEDVKNKLSMLEKENVELKTEITKVQATPPVVAVPDDVKNKLLTLEKENVDLKTQMAKIQIPAPVPAIPDEVKSKLDVLQKENDQLKAQLAVKPEPVAVAMPDTADEASKQTIKDLQNRVELAEAENKALKGQIDTLEASASQSQIKGSGNNWDLEQATRRYQEAQREIRRLGTLVEKQQVKCTQEKKDLEAMLFDPALAEKAQIAKLDTLEQQVAALQQGKTISSPEDQAKIAELEKKLQASQESEAKLAELQGQLNTAQSSNAEIAALQQKLLVATTARAELDEAKNKASASEAKVAELEKKLLDAEQSKTQISGIQAKAQEAEIAQAKIGELEKKLAEAGRSQAQIADLQKQLADAQTAQNQMASLQQQLAVANQSKAQVAELQKQLASSQAAQIQVTTLQQQLAAANQSKAQVAELQKQLASAQAAQSQVSALQQQLVAANQSKAQVAELQKQLASAQVAQQQVTVLQQQLAEANQSKMQVAALEQKLRMAEAQSVATIPPAAGNSTAPAAKVEPVAVSSIAAPTQALPSVTPQVPMATAVVSPIANVQFLSQEDFSGMVRAAGINARGGVETISSGSTDSYRAYRWKTDSLYGSAEQRAMKSEQAFDAAVNDYLERAKSRCNGDFAAMPSDVPGSFQTAKSFEIACIGGKSGTSASVLFTYSNNVMMTLAHEGKSEAMDLAMEARDRMAGQMGTMRTASR